MQRYRMRPQLVDAMQFDGTSVGADKVMSWAREVAPGHPVRKRIEYRGWDDTQGHLEMEIKDLDIGCMAGDWILVTSVAGHVSVWMVDDPTFRKYYEAV